LRSTGGAVPSVERQSDLASEGSKRAVTHSDEGPTSSEDPTSSGAASGRPGVIRQVELCPWG